MTDFRALTRQIAAEEGLNPGLFERQIEAESGYRPQIITGEVDSGAGVRGVAQLMPEDVHSVRWRNGAVEEKTDICQSLAPEGMATWVTEFGCPTIFDDIGPTM